MDFYPNPNVFFYFQHFPLSRSEYFKTKLITLVGDLNKVVKVEECTSFVLARVIDFMYDIKLPAELSYEDAKTVLAMADLYMMESLKDAAGSLIADRHLAKANILEISETAEKYTAKKLQERCCEFTFSNHASLDKKLLTELYKALPNLGEMAWQEIVSKGRPLEGAADILKHVLGINLTQKFKRRRDFQSDDEHETYVMANIKPNMLVLHNTTLHYRGTGLIPIGTLGKVEYVDFTNKDAHLKLFNDCRDSVIVSFQHLDLFTSPITIMK